MYICIHMKTRKRPRKINTRKKNRRHYGGMFTFMRKSNRKSKKLQRIDSSKTPITVDYLTNEVRTNYVKKNCQDSGLCLLLYLGTESTKIKKLFNNFLDFEYAIGRKLIGEPSDNGFVNEIIFQRNKYTAHAVLKSSIKKDSDNLWYEYLIGVHINQHYYHKFLCFVETYAAYRYQTDGTGRFQTNKGDMANNQNMKKPLSKMLSLVSYSDEPSAIADSCEEPDRLAILIQYIHNSIDFEDILNSGECQHFLKYDLIGCLYQVYFSLSSLSETFTHNDLHLKNVLLCPLPVSNTYILFRFHCENGTIITFKSKYIVKIIDYGKSYIKNLTDQIYDTALSECTTNPTRKSSEASSKGYTRQTHNENIDLRLFKMLPQLLSMHGNLYPQLVDLISEFKNVKNAEIGLRQLLTHNTDASRENTEYYKTYLQLGEIDISGKTNLKFQMTINKEQYSHLRTKKGSHKNEINYNYYSPTEEDKDENDFYDLRFLKTHIIDNSWSTDLYDSSGKYLGLKEFVTLVDESSDTKGRRFFFDAYVIQYLTNFYERRKYKNYTYEDIALERQEF